MNQPTVFISCVSPEFCQTRSRVAAILTRLGYTPVIQEIFGTEPGDLRQVLRDKIDVCEGLIQIVGDGYGADPPTVDAGYGGVSYTQFEFLYAREKKKKTWLIFAGKACTRDTALERLDLPNDPAHPDPASYQAERRALQLVYRDKRRNDGHLYYDATSDTELELKVERLRDELAKLRQPFNLWQDKVLRAFAVGFVLLALIGGTVWWFGYSQHIEIKEISEEARHITKEKIRAQLLESVERTRQGAVADAHRAKGWEERERLRQAAEKAYAESVSHIDELAASFAEIEGTNQSTKVFDEMTRILAGEGVEQALAYAATQRPGIMQKVKARAAAAREKNRTDLLPLLKSAQLQADRNQATEADSLFADVLALEPDWPNARNAFAWFLIRRGEVIEPMEGNTKLRGAVQICQGTLVLIQRVKSPQDWATTQNNLGTALAELGTRTGREQGEELLKDAVTAYRSALEVRTKADLPWDWAGTQNNLGIVLAELGTRRSGEEVPKLLEDSAAAYHSALEVYTKADLPQYWALTQNNLGITLQDLGERNGGEEGRKLLMDAITAYRSALEARTKSNQPKAWAQTQNNLGRALADLGGRIGGEEGRKLLMDAVTAYRSALEVRTKADLPQAWAQTQTNLGIALQEQGIRTGGEQGAELLGQAVAAYRSALEVRTREQLPQDWAATQNNLGLALQEQGIRTGGQQVAVLLGQAVTAYRSALEVRTREQLPQDWAATQSNLGLALQEQGIRTGEQQGAELLGQAVAAYRSAREIYTREQLPQDWAKTQSNLGLALQEQGIRTEGAKAAELLSEAIAADRSALEACTREQAPQDWATTQNNLGTALKDLGTRRAAEEGRKLLEDAVAAYRSALEVRLKADQPREWATTQNNLGTALAELGTRTGREQGEELLKDAVAAYRSALEVRSKADLPQAWATTQNNLGIALWTLGDRLKGEEGLKRERESVGLFRDVMCYQPNDLSHYRLASALGSLAYDLVLNSQFADAQIRCEEALRLASEIGDGVKKTDRDELVFIQGNLAHALLFQGHYDEALAIYRQYWDKPLDGKTFGEVTLEDFAAFDKAGLTHPDMSRMKQVLGDLRSNAPSP